MIVLDQPKISFYQANLRGSHPPLFTTRIVSEEGIARVKVICALWERIAHDTWLRPIKGFLEIDVKNRALACESMELLHDIQQDITLVQTHEKNYSLYIAVDTTKKVQAVALANLYSEDTSIHMLASNPVNLDIKSEEQFRVRGASTALVRHIAHDLLLERNDIGLCLSVTAYPGAVPFYEKLGFTSELISNFMGLTKPGLEALDRSIPETHRICSAEIEIGDLQP